MRNRSICNYNKKNRYLNSVKEWKVCKNLITYRTTRRQRNTLKIIHCVAKKIVVVGLPMSRIRDSPVPTIWFSNRINSLTKQKVPFEQHFLAKVYPYLEKKELNFLINLNSLCISRSTSYLTDINTFHLLQKLCVIKTGLTVRRFKRG